jgi:hypothetical protein
LNKTFFQYNNLPLDIARFFNFNACYALPACSPPLRQAFSPVAGAAD